MKATFLAKKIAVGMVGLALLVCGGRAAVGQTNIDMSAPGKSIDRGILGTNFSTQRDWAPVADRTMITGPAGGLDADMYDWQTQFPFPWWNTLGVLQNIRDSGSQPMFMVNLRGRVVGTQDQYDYTWATIDDIAGLSQLAAEWVRYTNFILPNGLPYAQQSASDKAILNKLTFGPLPPANQAPLPKVQYWEIGNEPDANILGTEFTAASENPTSHAHYLDRAGYVYRYKQITAAMKAVDPTIKVGPSISGTTNIGNMSQGKPWITDALLKSNATVDFWGYHAYDQLDSFFKPNGTPAQIATMEAKLRQVRTYQTDLYNLQRSYFTSNGRDPNAVEFRATEYNPMGTGTNDTSAPTMYQALAFTETLFTYAQLGIKSANYWGLLAYEPNDPKGMYNLWPLVKVWQKLDANIGATLVNSIIDDPSNRRVYVTRDSATGKVTVWGLNFDNDTDTSINLSLLNLAVSPNATLSVLNDGPGTTLWTADAAKWTTQNLSGFNAGNFNLNIPHASIVMLEVMPVPEPTALGVIGVGLIGLMMRRRRD